MKKNKFLFILLILTLLVSCDNEDEVDYSNQFIGEWMRSDFNDHFEFKLIFQSDNTGLRIYKEGTMETEITSSLVQFNWSANENSLIIDELGNKITTKYSINLEGELMLYNYSDLPFIKMSED